MRDRNVYDLDWTILLGHLKHFSKVKPNDVEKWGNKGKMSIKVPKKFPDESMTSILTLIGLISLCAKIKGIWMIIIVAIWKKVIWKIKANSCLKQFDL